MSISCFLLSACNGGSVIDVDKVDSDEGSTPPTSSIPDPVDNSPPAPSIHATSVTVLSLGIEENSCGIDSTGQLKCWGSNFDNSDAVEGLLGIGDPGLNTYDEPQDVNIGTSYLSISFGEFTVCALTNTNQVQCWGHQMSVGDTNYVGGDVSTPRNIDDTDSYITIASGSYHNCGITTDNFLKCWGDSWDGKLGRVGDNQDPLRSDDSTLYSRVAAGRNHTCGITTDKKLRCFGTNGNGQIGVGNTTSPQTPVEIDPGVGYDFISIQENNTCGITSDKKLKCWGHNGFGQVGVGSTGGNITSPTIIDGANDYKYVAVGSFHTCAITTSDKLKCWGSNSNGRLGDGTTTGPVNAPTDIDNANSYKSVSSGGSHTCALRLNGDLYCWGRNNRGQTGDNTTVEKHSPTQVVIGFN